MMTSRERLIATLNHRQPDRVCVDFGATMCSGIAATTLSQLRSTLLGETGRRLRIHEPFQMLGEIDDPLREALGIDVVGLMGRKTLFGYENRDWRPWRLFDGTEVEVPAGFVITEAENGDWLIHPQGDPDAPPSGRMPAGGFYFDAIVRQPEFDEDRLDPADNIEEFALLDEMDLRDFRIRAEQITADQDYGVIVSLPGCGLGDIAMVPAPFLKHPKGIRDVEEWYVSTVSRPDYVHEVFRRQTEIAVENIRRLGEAVGSHAQAAFVCGTDLGTQRAPFISPQMYRDLYRPYYRRLNAAVHEYTPWKTFKHCCGSIRELIPLMLEDGFDILNPVQCSAANMDARDLKRDFGRDLVFWGGGVDTQKTLPFGTPEEVYREVREQIEILNDGGGFVFSSIHNVQARTPIENLQAMFRAVHDSAAMR